MRLIKWFRKLYSVLFTPKTELEKWAEAIEEGAYERGELDL